MQGHHKLTLNIKALKISALLIFLYFAFEITMALFTGSLALLADAGHELSTVVAIGISLIALNLAAREPTPTRTFGYLRLEAIAAFLNGLLLLAMAVFILIKGFSRLLNPIELHALPMFVVALGGIGLEIVTLIILFKGQKENLNIRGSFWHVINAFLGSLAIIIAAIFVSYGIYTADSWAGIVFAFILIYGAYGIIKDSVSILIDVVPPGIDLIEIERDLSNIKGAISTHHLHARVVSSDIRTFSGHLVVEDLKNSELILGQAKQILDEKYGFSLSTLQLENESLSESDIKQLEYK